MNKLLALSITLTSLSLYGAEFSRTGLEGIAKNGLGIIVEDYSKFDKTFDAKAIKNQIELRLLQSGIKDEGASAPYLVVHAQPSSKGGRVDIYALSIDVKRVMSFEVNGKTYKAVASVWNGNAILGRSDLRKKIDLFMDGFLLDYLKANPKKKEK